MRLPLLLGACLLALASRPAPDYAQMQTFELILWADLVVAGEIETLEEETFGFRVDEIVAGELRTDRIEVARFEDWTCHARWASYAEGQQLLLFLARRKDVPDGWRVLGSGLEGEMPRIGTTVVATDTKSYRVRGFEVTEHRLHGATLGGTALPYDELVQAIRDFNATFLGTRNGYNWSVAPRNAGFLPSAFADRSRLARHLWEELSSSRAWTGSAPHSDVRLWPELLRGIERKDLGLGDRAAGDAGLGASLALLDVDGDGIADLVMPDPSDTRQGGASGGLWLLFLDAEGRVRRRTELRSDDWASGSSRVGAAVASLGDLDGDGVPELMVGETRWSGAEENTGGVWVLFLTRGGDVRRSVEIGHGPELFSLGVREGAGFGAAIAPLGDLDDDGSLEVALAQGPVYTYWREHGRSVFIVSLDPDGSVVRARRIHDREAGFTRRVSTLGADLATVGDLDGDGLPELAVSDTGDSDGGPHRGAVWILFLTPEAELRAKTKISDWAGDFEGRLIDRGSFGQNLAAPGDIDGDGIPDLLVASQVGLWTLLLDPAGRVHTHRLAEFFPKVDGEPTSFVRSLASRPRTGAPRGPALALGARRTHDGRNSQAIWWFSLEPDGALAPY